MAEHITNAESSKQDKSGRVLFVNEYTYTDELVERLARLRVSGKRRGMLLLGGCTLFAVGAVWHFSPAAPHWLGVLLVVIGIWCLTVRSNLWRTSAARAKKQMRADEMATGRFRRVVVDDEQLILSLKDGREQVYPWDEFTDFQMDDEVFAVVFGHNGVLVPKKTFLTGDAESFGDFLTAHLYPAGSMGPDTPNR